MMKDFEELVFNLRTGDPDTYFMCAIVGLCTFAVWGMVSGWL